MKTNSRYTLRVATALDELLANNGVIMEFTAGVKVRSVLAVVPGFGAPRRFFGATLVEVLEAATKARREAEREGRQA